MKNIFSVSRLAFLLIPVILSMSCRSGIDQIEVGAVDDLNFKSFENNTITFSARIQVINPNGYSLQIKEFDLRIVANGEYIGNLQNSEKVSVPAKSSAYQEVEFRLRLANIFTGAAAVYRMARQKNLKIYASGYVKARTSYSPFRKIAVEREFSTAGLK